MGSVLREAFRKLEVALRKQTNQAIARHKLKMGLKQGKMNFAAWYLSVKE